MQVNHVRKILFIIKLQWYYLGVFKRRGVGRMIHVQNIHVYRNGKTMLERVTWDVEKGQHWVVLGLNGSGKTTLLNVINGYLWPNEGTVQVLGETFGETYIPKLRTRIGWVSNAMMDNFDKRDPAIEIVLSGKYGAMRLFEKVSEQEVNEAVAIMESFHCAHLVNTSFEHLSQGERQRVQIARAFMAQPELLILDEPCSGLDVVERENVLQSVATLMNKPNAPTLIYVTHHVEEILPSFTHVLLMKKGESVGTGQRQEILTEQVLSQFFETPVSLQVARERVWLALT
jgi:iron complex transport system ATP-binding protein